MVIALAVRANIWTCGDHQLEVVIRPALMMLALSLPAFGAEAAGLSKADLICARATSASVQVPLTNAALIDQSKVDNAKTEITLLAKESLPHGESRQVFLLTLHERGGHSLTVVAASNSKKGECPYDDPKTYVVSKEL